MKSLRRCQNATGGRAESRPGGVLKSMICAALVALVGAVTALAAQPAHAYPVTEGSLTVVTGSLVQGGTVTATGGGFLSGTPVSIDVQSDPIHLADVYADVSGWISAEVTIPTGMEAGTHYLTATGAAAGGGTNVLSISFTVSDSTSTLATTGRMILRWTVLSLLMIIMGFVLVLVSRRQRRRDPNDPETLSLDNPQA